MALVCSTQPVTLLQAGGDVERASFGNLLNSPNASHCTFEGGDDPAYDAVYPDSYGGYEGPEDCGTVTPAYVMSTSCTPNEVDLTPAYEEGQCTEYTKLGFTGVTILYASGDCGVAGSEYLCLYLNGIMGADALIFNPSFPATCPFITSVGVAQIDPGFTIYEPEATCETVIYSRGGFCNVFAMPPYQKAAVETI